MARTPLGPRLIAAAIPSRFENLSKMQQALGVSYSTAHKWAKGTATPDWEHVELLADLLEVDPADLVREKPLPTSLRRHPERNAAHAGARAGPVASPRRRSSRPETSRSRTSLSTSTRCS
jgi:transcriptional regulator with XRE-family HTH domain